MTNDESGPASRWFAALTQRVHGWLPGALSRIPRTFVGFAMINSFTFCVDLLLLWLTHGVGGLPYPFSVTISFGLASVLAFFLNKVLNFRARGNTATQSTKYLLVIVSNYLIWILAFSSVLEWAGVHYQLSRIIAALIEGAYIYTLSRFWVFPPKRRKKASHAVGADDEPIRPDAEPSQQAQSSAA